MAPASAGSEWTTKLNEAQRVAAEAARLEFAKDYSASFAAYIKAGQTYLWLWQTHDAQAPGSSATKDVKTRLKQAAQKVLDRAELIKKYRDDVKPVERHITDALEQHNALAASDRYDVAAIYDVETDAVNALQSDDSPRPANPALSPFMVARNVSLQSVRDKLDGTSVLFMDNDVRGRDIVQDSVSDCSFIAGVVVCREHDASWGTKLAYARSVPHNEHGCPISSQSGKHLTSFHVNGRWRFVLVNDDIPFASDGTPICARVRSSVGSASYHLWPALLEKAYLSLWGSYDFQGSDSSIDLYALTGWIPEQVGFRHADFQREKVWARILDAFQSGQVLVTVGTSGRAILPGNDFGGFLVKSHNYAVLDMQEEHDARTITIMNPSIYRDSSKDQQALKTHNIVTMSWDDACAHLDSLFLNWNPAVFANTATLHGAWSRPTHAESDTLRRRQVLVNVAPHGHARSAQVWIHLARHIKFSEDRGKSPCWIAVSISSSIDDSKAHQHRVGRFVDGPHTLVQRELERGSHLITVSCEETSSTDTSFTITAHSNAQFQFMDPPQGYSFCKNIEGHWTHRNSGGNSQHATFVQNPQYLLQLPTAMSGQGSGSCASSYSIRATVETRRDIPVQILVVWATSSSSRTTSLRSRRIDHVAHADIVASSGSYTYGATQVDATTLHGGASYCIIMSTFAPGQLGDFKLTLQSNDASVLKNIHPIPAEGAGMHHRRLQGSWRALDSTAVGAPRHGGYLDNPSFSFHVTRRMAFACRLIAPDRAHDRQGSSERDNASVSLAINVAVFEKQSRREMASSGAYHANVCGAAIREAVLEAGEYNLIASTFDADVEADFSIDAWSEHAVVYTRSR